MPILQKRLQDKFKRDLCHGVDPDQAVAMGAAIQVLQFVHFVHFVHLCTCRFVHLCI